MVNHGLKNCVGFTGWRPDRAVSGEILRVIEGSAVEAALEAAERVMQQDAEWRRALDLELEQACYEAGLAARRYESVDPLCDVRSYVTFGLETLYWWPSPTIPRAHNYKDFRKAIRPASCRQRLVGLELPFTSQCARAAA